MHYKLEVPFINMAEDCYSEIGPITVVLLYIKSEAFLYTVHYFIEHGMAGHDQPLQVFARRPIHLPLVP